MSAKKWSDIRAQRFTPEELRGIDQEVESELLEIDPSRVAGGGRAQH